MQRHRATRRCPSRHVRQRCVEGCSIAPWMTSSSLAAPTARHQTSPSPPGTGSAIATHPAQRRRHHHHHHHHHAGSNC
jgi:hypothetical protein